jgi:hypothetical protein
MSYVIVAFPNGTGGVGGIYVWTRWGWKFAHREDRSLTDFTLGIESVFPTCTSKLIQGELSKARKAIKLEPRIIYRDTIIAYMPEGLAQFFNDARLVQPAVPELPKVLDGTRFIVVSELPD